MPLAFMANANDNGIAIAIAVVIVLLPIWLRFMRVHML